MFAIFMSHPITVCVCVCVCVCVSPLSPLHASPHQAGEDGHHHFLVDLYQVLGQRVDFGPDLPRHGNCVPDEAKDCS